MDMDSRIMESSMDPNTMMDDDQIELSVEYFASGEGVIPKSDETLGHLENLELMADNGGWPCGQLQRLLQSVRKIILPANLVRRLLSSLVPKDAVSGLDLAKLCIWALGNSAFSMDCVMLPTLRLVGLCLQYDCCTDRRPLASLYELFFGLLSKDKLTGVVAELLAVITTRDEVTQWRINKIIKIHKRLGSSVPTLDSLVLKYKQLRPDLMMHCPAPVCRAVKAKNTTIYKRFHKVWEDRIDLNRSKFESNTIWKTTQSSYVKNIFNKDRRDCLVPSAVSLTLESSSRKPKRDVTKALSECSSLKEMTDNLHRLQLPAQILSLLGCRVGVNVLLTDPGLVERLSLTLYHTLRNEFLTNEERKEAPAVMARKKRRRTHILQLLVDLQSSAQQGLPVVGRFLTEYLAVWDGTENFTAVLKLISQVQITDFKELYDCLLMELQRHFKDYSVYQQTIVLHYLGALLRSWAMVEHRRFNMSDQGEKEAIFPINSVHCDSSLQSILELSNHIGELTTVTLAQAMENQEDYGILVCKIFSIFKLSQKMMIQHKIPVRLEVPKSYFYTALFSYNAALINQACDYILLNKEVVTTLRQSRVHLTSIGDVVNAELVSSQLSTENLAVLNTVARDFLVFLAPGRTEVKSCSMLKQPWGLGKEAWLRDSLFVSSHPAFLSHVLNYLSSQNLEQEELSAAWLKLSEENSAAEFVNTALTELPAIVEFVATFSKPVSSKVNSSDQDSQSMCSRPTISSKDSGVYSSTQKDNDAKGVKRRSQEGEKHAKVERKKVQAAPPPSRAARMVESCISSNGKAGSTNSKGKKPVQEASRGNKTETVKPTVKPMLSRASRMVNTSRNSRKTAKED